MSNTTTSAYLVGDLPAAADLATPMAIRVAATIGVADRISEGRRDVGALAQVTGTDPGALELLLNHLVAIGVLLRTECGYALTELGQGLRSDHPGGLRARFNLDGSGHSALGMIELLHTVRTGESAYKRHFGHSFYEKCAADPEFAHSFHMLMRGTIESEARDIAFGYDWGALTTIADVGGGDGTLLIELLRAHPTLRGTVIDMGAAVEAALENIHAAGLEERADAVEASFFEELPSHFGGCVLSSVLPDWPDADALRILRNCARAVAPRGKVLVLKPSEKSRTEHWTTAQALRLYALQGGRERSLEELESLVAESGMRLAEVTDIGRRSIVELAAAAGQSTE
ncbi:methyltransferase [Nocardia sp. NPDC004604]|uniref:methyltransferase n=1 Tax=Nocardia sp. NPDC004604 TaxID=3157013 RepID=UPI0033A73EFD